MQTPLVECHNVELAEKEKVPQDVKGSPKVATGDEEVDLDPRAEFGEGRPMFDEPMLMVQLGTHPHQITQLSSSVYQLVKDEIERVLLANSDMLELVKNLLKC